MEDDSMKALENQEQNRPVVPGAPRAAHRRRIGLLRMTLVVLVTTVALICFIVWFRAWPQRADCAKQAQRLAIALDDYRRTHHAFPPVLDVLSIKSGRYAMGHFDYLFAGLGAPADPPDGTWVAFCLVPHRSLFSQPWRHVIFVNHAALSITWLPEKQFQEYRRRQRYADQLLLPPQP
jgi:hypothetical protein